MSGSDANIGPSSSQQKKSILQLVTLGCEVAVEVLRLVKNLNRIMDDPELLKLVAKIIHLGNSTWIPPGYAIDRDGTAALLGMTPDGVRKLAKRHHLDTRGPGEKAMVRTDDLMSRTLAGDGGTD